MDRRDLTEQYAVSPQIDPADFADIAAAGFTLVINNRPCAEVPPSHQAEAMQAAAEAAGLAFVHIPVTPAGLTMEVVTSQRGAIEAATGPVLAYCASGTRSTIVWALGQAGQMATDDILQAAAHQGYDLSQWRAQLDRLAQSS